MSISQSKYIDITSGLGGAQAVGRKALDGRIITDDALLPTNKVVEFYNAAEVGAYFGTNSDEYAFASKYFGFISKSITRAGMLSFARYTPQAAPATIRATKSVTDLARWRAITTGSMGLTIGGISYELSSINFSSVQTLADVASLIQTGIRANTQAGAAWTTAQVLYANNAFTLVSGTSGDSAIAYAIAPATTGATDISGMVGWNQASQPVLSDGAEAETITAALDRIANLSNNFGSFAFLNTLTLDEIKEAAVWTDLQNVQCMYSASVTPSDYIQVQGTVNGYDGVGLTYDIDDSMAYFMPMALMATTDYDRVNGVINYMYQQFPSETPAVTTNAVSDELDAMLINYLGQTQQAGKLITFYQRGFLQGEIADMGIFANEVWLKDALVTEWLNMFLALNQIPANESGVARMRNAAQTVIDDAQNNGTISVGKILTQTQKAYISEQTGDSEAWRQVYTDGYWLNPVLKVQEGQGGAVEYILNYVLIYSKGDSVRKVEGSNILI